MVAPSRGMCVFVCDCDHKIVWCAATNDPPRSWNHRCMLGDRHSMAAPPPPFGTPHDIPHGGPHGDQETGSFYRRRQKGVVTRST